MSNILQYNIDFSMHPKYDNDLNIRLGLYPGREIIVNKKSLLSIGSNTAQIAEKASSYQDTFKMFLFSEVPNYFYNSRDYQHILDIENSHDLTFTHCRYTGPWREKYFGKKYVYTHLMLDINYQCFPNEEKIFDVVYVGNYHKSPVMDYIFRTIRLFNSRIIGANIGNEVSYEQKMKYTAQARIAVTHNLMFLDGYPGSKEYIRQFSGWNECGAFSNLDDNLLPGGKMRVWEAAASKTLILHKRDYWNVIEDWFTPDEDFIYYDDEKDLRDKINEILGHYNKYKIIVENAYNKLINNYTTEHFINKYIKKYTE